LELCLVVDHDCNLRCRYCYTGRKLARPMSDETMLAALRLGVSRAQGWLSISLFGGEPLLHEGLLARVDRLLGLALANAPQPLDVRWLVNTNGTRLDDEALGFLSQKARARVFLSLDGAAQVHDRLRRDEIGKGSHARALQAVRDLHARAIPFEIMAVIDPDNAGELGESLAFLLGCHAEAVRLQPNLRADWNDAALERFRRGVRDAACVWADAFRQGHEPIVDPFHRKVISHLAGGAPWPARCQIATQELAVAPSGRIYPCGEMVGEDRDDALSVGDVVVGLDLGKVAALRARAAQVDGRCGECALRLRCQRNCACGHLALTGEVGRISSVLCEIETALIEATDEAAEALVGEGSRSFVDLYYSGRWGVAPGAQLVQLKPRAPND
jgi:uncharacterized protein